MLISRETTFIPTELPGISSDVSFIGIAENANSIEMYRSIEERMGKIACELLKELFREIEINTWQKCDKENEFSLTLKKRYTSKKSKTASEITVSIPQRLNMSFSKTDSLSSVLFSGGSFISGQANKGFYSTFGSARLKKINIKTDIKTDKRHQVSFTSAHFIPIYTPFLPVERVLNSLKNFQW